MNNDTNQIPEKKPMQPIPFKPRSSNLREGLDLAVQITGKSRNHILNDALEKYLPEIGSQEEEKRLKLLEEFRKKFPTKTEGES